MVQCTHPIDGVFFPNMLDAFLIPLLANVALHGAFLSDDCDPKMMLQRSMAVGLGHMWRQRWCLLRPSLIHSRAYPKTHRQNAKWAAADTVQAVSSTRPRG